jgi:murein DD-endopeptidase MepM/ murein hydrolase activator NlpD
MKNQVDELVKACQQNPLHHPLENPDGITPGYRVPQMGKFGAGKGPTRKEQHHPATDLHIGNRESVVNIYAAHDGVVSTVRDAPKYRHYVAVMKVVTDESGKEVGKLVTLYGHVDLDLDEANGLAMNGKTVKTGDLISKHLYEGTRGGPHLHFEIRYYRPADKGDEEFYGFRQKVPGAGDWPWGKWDPEIGFGYGHPANFSLHME